MPFCDIDPLSADQVLLIGAGPPRGGDWRGTGARGLSGGKDRLEGSGPAPRQSPPADQLSNCCAFLVCLVFVLFIRLFLERGIHGEASGSPNWPTLDAASPCSCLSAVFISMPRISDDATVPAGEPFTGRGAD